MSRATDVAAQLKAAFPGIRITSTGRSPAQQRALVASGATRATHSQHNDGNGIDMVLPSDVAPSAIRDWLSKHGIDPGEFLNESGKGKAQGTGPHLHIGLAPKGAAKGGDSGSAGGGSTFDKAKARQRAQSGSTLDDLYTAYKSGRMTPQDATQFEHAVEAGEIMLPRGGKLNTAPQVAELPRELLDAYNSHRMDDDPEGRAEIEKAVTAGQVRLPKGVTLAKPNARTFGEKLGIGARAVTQGIGGIVDAALGSVMPQPVVDALGARRIAGMVYDNSGIARPESNTEKLVSAGVEGATMGLAGGAGLVRGAGGIALDALSGATSGLSSETARQAGAGPAGQLVAGIVGGGVPVGIAGGAARLRAPKSLPEVVETTPREAVFDHSGNLTEHGQEIAARHSVTPEEVRAAYEAPPTVRQGVANEEVPQVAAREATTGRLVAEPVPDAEPAPRPVESAPVEPAQPVERPLVEPAPEPVAPMPEPATAFQRVEQGNEFGVPYTRGQATKNFDIQDAEQRLRNSNGPEADQMRAFASQQADAVKQAVSDFKAAVSDKVMTAEERGKAVQDAVRELRDHGQKGVSALYKQARDLGQEVPIETGAIRQVYDRLMVEANVPAAVKEEITQEAARYGLIGKPEVIDKASGAVTGENGVTTVVLDNGQKVRFYGQPETLRLDNAEEFRKVISRLYPSDGPRKLTSLLKPAIDDAVEAAAARVASEEGSLPEAMGAARAAHKEQVQTYKAGDVVQKIADWKKGQEDVTSVLKPEEVLNAALGKTSDLKRLKAVLLSKPTPASKAAWSALQAHGIAEIFDKATTKTTNLSGEITDSISGAKLRTSIDKYGVDKLKVLLDTDQFNTLMRLRRTIEDVTIPISGTVNHSNSGNLLMRLMKDADNKVTAALSAAGFAVGGPAGAAIGGAAGRTIGPAVKAMKETAAAKETLKGATEYTPAAAKAETASAGATPIGPTLVDKAKGAAVKTMREFIDIYSSPRVIAPVLAAGASDHDR